MKRSPKEWEFIVKPAAGTKLPSGGIYPPWGHIGHWEVTGKVLEEMGFSAPGSDILCDAAQDPDFYEFGTAAAHAQTPDDADLCGSDSAKRTAIINQAVEDYLTWLSAQVERSVTAVEEGNTRLALYWLGYALHGVEDLAVHKGITNGEHASTADNPDFQAGDVALSYVYARRVLDAFRDAVGQDNFDRLRNHDGDGKLGFLEKRRKDIHPEGWDIDTRLGDYKAAGERYVTITPRPAPVRWDREVVLSRVLDTIVARRVTRMARMRRKLSRVSANPHRRFEVLTPCAPLATPAQWSILVYMAGDDRNPRGIEYAIAQDLAEIKQVGSTDAVHFLVQTDDATGTASYRYRLRKGTDLASDRLERFNGDLNTGSTKTLVDFVQWAHCLFPAERTALVLWGHGSGHDDQNVYRAIRGNVTPRTAARLAQRRLGFFSGTRRSLLAQGPTRGYGYDDTAGDFLDNAELRKALLQVRAILGRKLDLLGFDACLMAMIEVAYQIHDVADILVASERAEPGDGWSYGQAFRRLHDHPGAPAHGLARDIVRAYRRCYANDMTLSAIELAKIPPLARRITAWTRAADPGRFHLLRRRALDCSPRAGDGYCDLGSFLDAAADAKAKDSSAARAARRALKEAVLASCGRASGLTIYAPGNFRPEQAGSTDALYLGLDFVRETGWRAFLERVYSPLDTPAPGIERLPIPAPATGLDRFNVRRVLAAVRSGAAEGWLDRLRGAVLGPCRDAVASTAEQLDKIDPPSDMMGSPPAKMKGDHPAAKRRILILPGILGSLLHDRSGKLGAVWIDPLNLVFGDDFEALKLQWETEGPADAKVKAAVEPIRQRTRIPDADAAVQIEAYGVVPLIYDRMALALMHAFGPVVEFAPFDWRQPIGYLGRGLAARIEGLVRDHPGIQIALVAHSMGGLVVTDALATLAAVDASALDAVKALVALGAPFLGASSALQALRAEREELQLLKLLGGKSAVDILDTVQTFRGLIDLLPGDQADLLKPSVFAPGPLSRLQPGDVRLTSPRTLVRDLPRAMHERTRAVVCTTKSTTGAAVIREDGSVDYPGNVAGDGTVSAQSALNAGTLLAQSYEVDEGHMTLPLDGKAIVHTVEWVGRRFGMAVAASSARVWPAAPDVRRPASRAEVMRRLEAEDELSFGDFVALLSLV